MTRKTSTSITLDRVVLKNSRIFATSQGYRSFSAFVEDLLREKLDTHIFFKLPGIEELEEVGVD